MSDDLQVARLQLLAAALELDADDLSGRARPRVRAAQLELDEAAKRIVALLAERDGLKRDMGVERAAADAWKALCETPEAALADALGLLREIQIEPAEDGDGDILSTSCIERLWVDRRNAFLAKHGPSP